MDNQKKKDIMKQIDHYMAEHDTVKLDSMLKELQEDFDNLDDKFAQIVLGYTGVFRKVLNEWTPLYELVDQRHKENR